MDEYVQNATKRNDQIQLIKLKYGGMFKLATQSPINTN